MSFLNLLIIVIITSLVYSRDGKLASNMASIASIMVSFTYTIIAFRCRQSLHLMKSSSSKRPHNQQQQNAKHLEYASIGNFLLMLNCVFSLAHLCHAFLYFMSAHHSLWYRQHFSLLQLVFKTADIVGIFASMAYICRSIHTIRLHRNAESKRAMTVPKKHPSIHTANLSQSLDHDHAHLNAMISGNNVVANEAFYVQKPIDMSSASAMVPSSRIEFKLASVISHADNDY